MDISEVLESPGFWMLGGGGTIAVLAGYIMSKRIKDKAKMLFGKVPKEPLKVIEVEDDEFKAEQFRAEQFRTEQFRAGFEVTETGDVELPTGLPIKSLLSRARSSITKPKPF